MRISLHSFKALKFLFEYWSRRFFSEDNSVNFYKNVQYEKKKSLRLKWNTGRSLTQIWFRLVRLKILSFWITIVFNWFKSFCINPQYYLFLFGRALSLSIIKNETLPPPSKNNKKCGNSGFLAVWDFSLVLSSISIYWFSWFYFQFSSKHFKKIIIISRTNQDRYAICFVYYHYNHCT